MIRARAAVGRRARRLRPRTARAGRLGPGIAAGLAAGLLVVLPAAAPAQVVVESGHALDSNLRLGSGGYNTAVGGRAGPGFEPLRVPTYVPRDFAPDYYNAFLRERYYVPTRWAAPHGDTLRYSPPQKGSGPQRTQAAATPLAAAYGVGYVPRPTQPAADPPEARRQMQLLSYGIGYLLGERVSEALRRDGVEADPSQLSDGFHDGLQRSEPAIARDKLDEILASIHARLRERMAGQLAGENPEFRAWDENNRRAGAALRESFAREEGVISLPGGLMYRELEAGEGPSPGPQDVVVLDYRITAPDGTVILEARGAVVQMKSVVEGGRMLLGMMRPGARWVAIIPPELGHGDVGRPPHIGPSQTVRCDVRLLEIRPGP
jgi:FKBP-type peptidyl-prolyl cis-trans isomerase